MFNFDANENSHLRFVLEKVKGSKTEIMAYGDLPFLHEVRPEEPQTVDATFALVRYRGKGSTPGPEEGIVGEGDTGCEGGAWCWSCTRARVPRPGRPNVWLGLEPGRGGWEGG